MHTYIVSSWYNSYIHTYITCTYTINKILSSMDEYRSEPRPKTRTRTKRQDDELSLDFRLPEWRVRDLWAFEGEQRCYRVVRQWLLCLNSLLQWCTGGPSTAVTLLLDSRWWWVTACCDKLVVNGATGGGRKKPRLLGFWLWCNV